ncbi:MAG TPA: hypothetical protein VF800_28030 [Telluria sp.]|jgi:hypothetical protein
MNVRIDEKILVSNIRVRFPSQAALTDQWLAQRGWKIEDHNDLPYMWVEAFADWITDAIKRRDVAGIRDQTGFLADQYRAAPDALWEIVAVAYAENIMWNASDEEKAWAWEFIAREIQQLYEEMWRDPTT